MAALRIVLDASDDGILREMCSRIAKEEKMSETARLKRDREAHKHYAAGLREGLVLVDAAIRSSRTRGPVSVRTSYEVRKALGVE